MLELKERVGNRQPISADQVIGNFGEQTKGYTINFGKSYGKTSGLESYWVTASKDGKSEIMNVSKSFKTKIDASLEGVTDVATRTAMVLKFFSEGTILKVVDNNQDGTPKVDADGNIQHRYLLGYQGENGFAPEAVNAAVAKAAGFSIKAAMINRI